VATPAEVTEKQIEHLDARQLTEVLKAVVDATLIRARIGIEAAQIPRTLDMSDDGEDGIVSWSEGPSEAGYIKQRRTQFQVKAGKLQPADCRRELLKDGALKPRVADNLSAGGAYVLFLAQPCTGKMKEARKAEIRKVIAQELGADVGNAARIEIFSGDVIASWVNEHYGVALLAHRLLGVLIPDNFLPWESWSQLARHNRTQYQRDAGIDDQMRSLRSELLQPRSVLRMIGLSGLGKTRLALETFRPSLPGSTLANVANSVIYVDDPEDAAVLAHIHGLVHRSRTGIVVVDNCSLTLHQKLRDVIDQPNSLLSLLTIDLDLAKDANPAGLLEIGQSSRAVIHDILRSALPAAPAGQLERMVVFVDGFPRLAVQLIESGVQEDLNRLPLTGEDFTERLLWGRDAPDDAKRRTIEACALFHHVGIAGPVESHLNYVAQCVCHQSPQDFFSTVQYFRRRGLIDGIGDFVRVTPLPLAITLAESWFVNTLPSTQEAVLRDEEMPAGLAEALAQRFSSLSPTERAAEMVRRMMGISGPFVNLGSLNNKRTSRLLRALVSVEPDSCLDMMVRVLGPATREELLAATEGRREFVWALERLIYDRTRFLRAGRLLAALAIAENETWSNNASNQFVQLFHLQLSGTEAEPQLRLSLVDELLSSGDERQEALAITALGAAVATRYYTRTGGAEEQGFRTYRDWAPRTLAEQCAYFNEALRRLAAVAPVETRLGDLARHQLAAAIRTQVYSGNLRGIDEALRNVRGSYAGLWSEALTQAQEALRYEGRHLDPKNRQAVIDWEALLLPTSLADRLLVHVSKAPFGWGLPEIEFSDLDRRSAAFDTLVADFAAARAEWPRLAPLLVEGEQRRTFDFGREVGRLVEDDGLLDLVIARAQVIRTGTFEPSFLAGLLHARRLLSIDRYRAFMKRCADVDSVRPHFVWINAVAGLVDGDLERLHSMLTRNEVAPDDFRVFTYGRVLESVPSELVAKVFTEVSRHGETGGWTTLSVLSMYINDDGAWLPYRNCLASVIRSRAVALSNTASTMDRYAYDKVAKRFMTEEPTDPEPLTALAAHAVALCQQRELNFSAHDMLRPLVFELLSKHAALVWPTIREAIAGADHLSAFHWAHLLTDSPVMQEKHSAFNLLSTDEVLSWVGASPPVALFVVLKELPLFRVADDGQLVVNALLDPLIEQFGNRQDFLSTLSANLHSFSWTGSAEPLFRQRQRFVERYRHHRHPRLAAWASAEYGNFGKLAFDEQKRQEEWDAGILEARFPQV